jgi:hypothetical protein
MISTEFHLNRINCIPCPTRVVTATDGQTRPSVTSDKVLVRQIRVNAILTSDKVKPELLCPQWLLRRCHIEWLDVSFYYIARAAEHIALLRARTGAIGVHTAGEWGAHG